MEHVTPPLQYSGLYISDVPSGLMEINFTISMFNVNGLVLKSHIGLPLAV